MRIDKITITNFKSFKEKFTLKLNQGVNILVGDNATGKSTILEAIHLALSGCLNGKYLKNELTPYLFNKDIEQEYIASLKGSKNIPPPSIAIEIYFSNDDALALLEGNGNSNHESGHGIRYCIEFDEHYKAEYNELINSRDIKTIPIEYYTVTWESFARTAITTRSIPVKSSLIDSSIIRIQNGTDAYVSKIIRENLEDKEKVQISQAHRQMKETFMESECVKAINEKINVGACFTDKSVKISVDLSTQNAWETSLITYLDDIPFQYIGKGEQSIVKTYLALSHKKSQEANIILLEEPENHLSHSKLNELIERVTASQIEKQIIITTHSSFVANKLGIEKVIFLHNSKTTRLNELSHDTQTFFRKLAGYDTLRLILCKRAILVEGDSDELIVQKAYRFFHNGKLPISNGTDVISVGTSFLRFLEIAERINKNVVVVTDNDGNLGALKKKYEKYLGENAKPNIKICFDSNVDTGNSEGLNLNTLEPNLLKANNIETLNNIFDTNYSSTIDLLKYMKSNKTECAIKIFDTNEQINFPDYILSAVITENEQ